MDLIATRSLTYGTRRLLPGDKFEASRMNGRLLIAIKKAKAAVGETDTAEQAGAPQKERRRSKRTKD